MNSAVLLRDVYRDDVYKRAGKIHFWPAIAWPIGPNRYWRDYQLLQSSARLHCLYFGIDQSQQAAEAEAAGLCPSVCPSVGLPVWRQLFYFLYFYYSSMFALFGIYGNFSCLYSSFSLSMSSARRKLQVIRPSLFYDEIDSMYFVAWSSLKAGFMPSILLVFGLRFHGQRSCLSERDEKDRAVGWPCQWDLVLFNNTEHYFERQDKFLTFLTYFIF